MKHSITKNFIFPVIVLIAGVIFALSLTPSSCLLKNQWCGQDLDQYKDYSDSMMSGHGFSARVVSMMYFINPEKEYMYVPEILRLPAYPMILTLSRMVYNNPVVVLYFNFFCYIGILIYSFFIGRQWLSGWLFLLYLFFIAFNPVLLFYTSQMGNADIFAGLVSTGFFFHLWRTLEGKYTLFEVGIVCLYGILAIFSRQNTLIFVFILCFGAIYIAKTKLMRKYITIVALIICLSVISWMIRNYTLTNTYTLSAYAGMQFYSEHVYFSPFQNAETSKLNTWLYTNKAGQVFIAQERKKDKTIPQAYALFNDKIMQMTQHYMLTHPKETILQLPLEISSFYTAPTYEWQKKGLFSVLHNNEPFIGYILLGLLSLYPIFLILSRKKFDRYIFILWVAVVFFSVISAFAHGIVIANRGILPIMPLLALLCALSFKDGISAIILYAKHTHK